MLGNDNGFLIDSAPIIHDFVAMTWVALIFLSKFHHRKTSRYSKMPKGTVFLKSYPAPIVGALLLSLSAAVSAGGLTLYEVGTADVGLASAGYSARAQDASTVLTNPAGMSRLPGSQLLLGAQMLYADIGFEVGSGTSPGLGQGDGGNPVGWFPGGGLFYTQRISPDLSFGFAATGNFGLSQSFDSDWVGRYYIQEGTLLGVSLLPSLAWKLNPEFSVGASLNATYGISQAQVAVNNARPGYPDGMLEMDATDWGFGVNLGALYEPSPATRFGLVYNSAVKLDFAAPAEFSGLAPGMEALLGSRGLLNAQVDLGITIPQGVNASFFHQIDDRWAMLGSLGWQQWSAFGKVDVGIDSNNPVSLTSDAEFDDTWHLALGGQHRLSPAWMLNFGMAYDSAFQDSSSISPTLPSNEIWRLGLGVQNQGSRDFEWGVGLAYAWSGALDVNQSSAPPALGGRGNLVGSYDTSMLFLSANFIWKY